MHVHIHCLVMCICTYICIHTYRYIFLLETTGVSCVGIVSFLVLGEETTMTMPKQLMVDQAKNSETTQETTLRQLGGKQRRNNYARKQQ